MSSPNYLICQQCQSNIPLITIFFDVEGLKIQYKCKCMNKFKIITGKEFIKEMNNKNNRIKGYCQKNKNHKNILAKIYCFICNKKFCSVCADLHFIEYNNNHKTISNDINKVLNNKKNILNKGIKEKSFEELIEKIENEREFLIQYNKKIYYQIINEIKESKNESLIKYAKILSKSYNFNNSINNIIYSLYDILKSNYIHLKKYSLEEPFQNLFFNFIINENKKIFNENDKDIYNNLLKKISLCNEYFINYFLIQKKVIYPEISSIVECKGHTSSIDCIVQLFDGRIATGSSDGSVKIWDEQKYKLIKTLKINGKLGLEPIYSIHQMKNNFLIYGTEGGNFSIWDIDSYQNILFIKNCHSKSIWGFMNVGKNKIVSISEDWTIKVWNIHNFKLLRYININDGMILSEWTTKDGNLITGVQNGKILVWDMNNYYCIKEFNGHNSGVDYIIQLNDYRIVSGAQDMKLKIWDYFTGECLATLTGHTDTIESLLQLNDTRIVSASWDKNIKIWDIYNFQCLLTIKAHNDYILVIELLKNGNFASGSADNILKIWEPIYNENQIIKINK